MGKGLDGWIGEGVDGRVGKGVDGWVDKGVDGMDGWVRVWDGEVVDWWVRVVSHGTVYEEEPDRAGYVFEIMNLDTMS